MSDNESDEFSQFSEIEDFALSNIASLLLYQVHTYGSCFDTDVQMNRFFVRMFAIILGDMLAHFPEEEKEQVISEAYDQIVNTQDLTEAFIKQQATMNENEESQQYDLSKMTPMGSA